MGRIFLILLAIFFSCSTGFADTAEGVQTIYQSNDILASSFRVVWGLLIVLGVILILYALLKKRFSVFATGAEKEIKIIEIKPLLGKKALCLVEVRGREYLLGISDNHISNIAAIAPKKHSTSFEETLQAETGEAG